MDFPSLPKGVFLTQKQRPAAHSAGRLSVPPPPVSRNPGTPATRAAPPSLSLRTSAHAGVASRSPASRRLARPGRGAILARVYDRPHGRCNAFALRENGLPRRCAPRNDSFGSLVGLEGTAKQICRCPAGAPYQPGHMPGLPCRNPSAPDPSPLAQDDRAGGAAVVL